MDLLDNQHHISWCASQYIDDSDHDRFKKPLITIRWFGSKIFDNMYTFVFLSFCANGGYDNRSRISFKT